MRNLLIVVAIGALGIFGWLYIQQSKADAYARRLAASEATRRVTAQAPARVTVDANAPSPPAALVERPAAAPAAAAQPDAEPRYRCDGRIYCSQMTSCEEAEWFLANCPGVKMDGENNGKGDGVPCERQWCGGG